jgi:hypothetical protein
MNRARYLQALAAERLLLVEDIWDSIAHDAAPDRGLGAGRGPWRDRRLRDAAPVARSPCARVLS